MEILNKLILLVQFGITHYSDMIAALYGIVSAVTALCAALIVFFTLIPGEQPEKAVGQFQTFIAKYSRKKPEPTETPVEPEQK